MKSGSVLQSAGRHRPWVPYFVLAVALALTIVATIYVDRTSLSKDRLRFDAAVQQTQAGIDNQLETYISMLRATGALFAADSMVSAADFGAFVRTLELPTRYPGIQGIGFSLRLPAGRLDSLEAALREVLGSQFHYRPAGARDEHHTILYLEPRTPRNLAVIGFDMFSEPTRRRAMEMARDSGRPTASGKVRLIQETGRNVQAGFLIYYPIYRGGRIPETVEARRRELVGFVYGPFRAGNLLSRVFASEERPRLHMAVFDGDSASSSSLLYRSGPADTGGGLSAMTRLDVAGRPWTVLYAPRAAFDMASARTMTPYILVAGLIVSLLFFYLARSEAEARYVAEQIASDLGRSRDALARSETRFRTMIEQSPLAIQLFSLDGACVHANESWETLWEASRTALDDYNVLQDAQMEAQGLMPEVQRAFAGQSVFVPPFRYDPQAIGKPGRPRWVRLFFYPIRTPQGELTEVALKAEDVTEQIDAQRELSLAKEAAEAANRAKDRFLAVLSHELRTPLTPVLAAIQMIEEEPEDVIRGGMIEIIRRNVELEARLIDDLLDLTRISNGKLRLNLQPADLHLLIGTTIEISRGAIEAKHIDLELELKAKHHIVNGDPARIHQVLWNLINNAVKFTPDRGHLAIRTRNVDDRIELEVEDTGIGIESEVLPRIFDAFEQGEQTITRRYGGLGLGLAISRVLVDMHGGHLSAASDGPGKGARFTVSLDTMKLNHTVEPADTAEAAPEAAGGARILLVDDHYDTNHVMKLLLEQKGYRVLTADSVTSALEIARHQPFDLLISDIGLPDGSGLELMQHLSRIRPVPGIALSGFGMEDDIRKSLDAGFRRHLIKPVNVRLLQEVVEQLVG